MPKKLDKKDKPKLKKSIKARWLKDLRSGDYQQITGSLKDEIGGEEDFNFGYCCLGVLCLNPKSPQEPYYSDTELEPDTLEWCGLTENAQSMLINLNDTKKWSFKRIAAYIDRYL